jgi:hypothetical protein
MPKSIVASANAHGNDSKYLELLIKPLRVCAKYKPKFGKGGETGLTLPQFQRMYGSDPFYSWVGLNSPLMYAAHKAAGGMTSVYRQLGIGGQWLVNRIIQDTLGIDATQASWSYEVPKQGGATRTLSLDGRIELGDIGNQQAKRRVAKWMKGSASKLVLAPAMLPTLKGAVFEVRQGYKSADSKRQNADIANSANAYANLYLPVILLLSTQISGVLATRYVGAKWLLLSGTTDGDSTDSTYVFCREVLGYDLASFFERNSNRIRLELEAILKNLLQA